MAQATTRNDYIISTHGNPKWGYKTTIPDHVSVRFYQPFGKSMDNTTGLRLQSALAHPRHAGSADFIQRYRQMALWHGPGQEGPEVYLTGADSVFYSGIVHLGSNKVVERIGRNKLMTLSAALAAIRAHAGDNTDIVVHCVFCR